MELRDYFRSLRRNWVFILILAVAGLLVAGAISLVQPAKFRATATVFVSTSSGDSISELQQGSAFAQQRVRTYADLVDKAIVRDLAKVELGLESVNSSISATIPTGTLLIEIAVTDEDPALAAQLATALSEALTEAVVEIEPENSPIRLTLVQPAVVPQSPISPNIPLNLGLGLVLGLAAGVATGILREVLDTRVRSEHDVEAVTDRPLIGGIVHDPKAKSRPLIVQADPRSPRAESFRTLRTNLQFIDADRTQRGFVVTSSIESEGKSTTTANLAIALAETGLKVLLVDADLRRPKMAAYMGIEGAVGLTDVLIGRATIQETLQRWGRHQLYLLPAGTIPPNPSELLGSVVMSNAVQQLQSTFDVVLYDSPPLLPVTDAALLSRSVGGTIVIAAAGRVHRNQLSGAIASLEHVGAHISGIVLTMLPTKGPDAYGQQRYGHAYGYGYPPEKSEQPLSRRQRRGD